MQKEIRFTTAPETCPYLADETAQLNYRLIGHLTPEQYEGMLDRGWRRFGYQFFRPICPACARCRSLRVDVARFVPNKSQRRVLKANADLKVQIAPVTVSSVHLQLYHEYHAFMAVEKGWKERSLTMEEYAAQFWSKTFTFAHEFRYFLGEQLVGLGLVDLTPRMASSIYFFHHPTVRSRSLGVFSMLTELRFARSQGLAYHHLGYWVPENSSMLYKQNYRPFELLIGYPGDDESPCWVPEEDWQPVLNSEDPGEIVS